MNESKGLAAATLRKHEGYRKKVYKCPAGFDTVGYGRNLETNGVTRAEAEILLQNDVAACAEALDGRFGWFHVLSDVRQAVLIDMAVNMGITRLRGFKLMLKALSLGDYEAAAREMHHSKWRTQVPGRARRLIAMMRSNEFPADVPLSVPD